MLAKKYRIPSSFFKKVEKEKINPVLVFSSPFFLAKLFSSSLEYARFAVVASGSLFKSSVLRNKARRNAYEAIRLGKFFEKKNVDCVLYLKKAALEASREQIEIELRKIFN